MWKPMALVFHGTPFVKDRPRLAVWLQGRDEAADCYVDCRVTQEALKVCCGAKGIADDKLLGAFEAHRERIETAAKRKYATGHVEHLKDRKVVWLEVADL